MTDLAPARELAMASRTPYPNEDAAYGAARTDLLAEEIELRRHIERVAARRRALPPGGAVPEDYAFTGEDGRTVRLSDLFGDGDTLMIYIWMFGPQRARPCPMCTNLLDALDGNAEDINQRVPFIVVGRSPIERQAAFGRERGWRHLRLYSTDSDDFMRAYRGTSPDGAEEWPAMIVFRRDAEGTIRLFWAAEMGGGTADPGQDPRGAPDPMPIWTMLDLTPAGRGTDWYPRLAYD